MFMTRSLLGSVIEDPVDIELIGWIMLMVGAISLIFGMMAALAGLTAQMNGSVVGRLLLFVTIGALAIWLGSKVRRWAKNGSIKNRGELANIRPLTLIVAIIVIVVIMMMMAPNLFSVEFQLLMAAGLITVLLVWLQKNRKPTAIPA
jgi:peptidoglycan/LPS O-acetylase OafA/YrhL